MCNSRKFDYLRELLYYRENIPTCQFDLEVEEEASSKDEWAKH